ncbi:unnamed protein product [Parnassius apollo]|uniref:(apollo) hypothetical protein n=1 Tax=Parnassius apollo TaxID=110799 RepID=A0A8S3XSJ3_PARAO|nr:unnamed protein product [Parnassius apollo]
MHVETSNGDNIESEDAEDSEDVSWVGEVGGSAWQREDGVALAALRAVFSWLDGGSLMRAASVCRVWRTAADEPALWRRCVLPRASPAQVRALRRASAAAQLHCVTESSWSGWSWRREYWLAAARWLLRARLPAAGGAAVTHAALSHAADRIAVTADDASLTVPTL